MIRNEIKERIETDKIRKKTSKNLKVNEITWNLSIVIRNGNGRLDLKIRNKGNRPSV